MNFTHVRNYFRSARNGLDNFVSNRLLIGPSSSMSLNHEKDVVVVTGGANGLGHEIVKKLTKKGTKNIIVLDIDDPLPYEKIDTVYYYKCDIGDEKVVIDTSAQIIEKFGPITVLINNAGITISKFVEDLTYEDVLKTLSVNLISAFTTIRTFLPGMLKVQRGYIVTISSVLGYMSPAKLSVYGASKAGLIALHESLTYELGPPSKSGKGIKTLLVTPGQLNTPLFFGVETPNEWLAPILMPEEVAAKIVKAMELGSIETISTPLYTNFLPIFRALPWRITELARRLSGIDQSMETFRGRHSQSQKNELN